MVGARKLPTILLGKSPDDRSGGSLKVDVGQSVTPDPAASSCSARPGADSRRSVSSGLTAAGGFRDHQ